METWLRLDCRCLCREAEQAARIAAERIGEMTGSGRAELRLTFSETETEGYVIEVAAPFEVRIGANRSRNFIAGVGELLRLLLASADEAGLFGSGARCASSPEPAWPGLPAGRKEYIPAVKERIHYLPGHFGNSFEVCWEGEMRRYLEDLALSGASGYGDWFDPNDMPDPYHPHVFHSSSMFLWRRKKEWLKISQELGLDNVLVVTPNIGFVDQMRPEWVGVRDHKLRVQGQVLCPSNPEARQVILNNHRQLFEDLAQSGIRIGKIVCAPYDDGGCACPKCQPYYPVFLKLVHDVYEVACPSFPELKADICGWWTSEEESILLREFALGPACDWFGAYQLSAAYDVRALDAGVRSRIGDMKLGCFLHIGFSRDRRDVYTQTGVHSAARRLQSVIGSFSLPNCESFMTYNESFGDHYNAFVAGLLGYDPQRDAREIAMFYGRLVLGLGGDRLRTFADVLLEMEDLDGARAEAWTAALREMAPYVRTGESQEWAFEHVRLKAELMRLDHRITGRLAAGEEPELPVMRERLKLTERLWRHVYGFGVLRHILIPERMLPSWYSVYRDRIEKREERIESGHMAEDA